MEFLRREYTRPMNTCISPEFMKVVSICLQVQRRGRLLFCEYE
jgi:hypothetical protein